MKVTLWFFTGLFALLASTFVPAFAQTAPSASEAAGYSGLHQAAQRGDIIAIRKLVTEGADVEARDVSLRTPLHIAAFASHEGAVSALIEAGADLEAYDSEDYDILTIAAVAGDLEMLNLILAQGANAGNITSHYEGTALIAASHLGQAEIVERLIGAGAPLDHINNIGWTALLESIILGDGGPEQVRIVRALIAAGADKTIPDREGVSPLEHARRLGYADMVAVLE